MRLDEVVLRALEKEPELRYQQASEVKTQIEAITASAVVSPASDMPIGPPLGAMADVGNGVPRFSRLAVAGAAWAPLFFVMAFLTFFVRTGVHTSSGIEPPGPEWWQQILIFTVLPLGLLAPFGTTILGAVAMAQIRRSAGRLYGLGLALFDTLFFPLLALDILIWAMLLAISRPLVQEMGWTVGRSDLLFFVFLATILMSGLLDIVIIRWAWRAAKTPVGNEPIMNRPQPKEASPALAWIALGLFVAGLLGGVAILALKPEAGMIFGLLCEILALVFGILGRRHTAGKVAWIGVTVLLLLVFVAGLAGYVSYNRVMEQEVLLQQLEMDRAGRRNFLRDAREGPRTSEARPRQEAPGSLAGFAEAFLRPGDRAGGESCAGDRFEF